MPALNEQQKTVNTDITLELQAESARSTMKAYSNNLYAACSDECIRLNSFELSQTEKQCLLTCFRRRNMAVNSFTRSLLTEL